MSLLEKGCQIARQQLTEASDGGEPPDITCDVSGWRVEVVEPRQLRHIFLVKDDRARNERVLHCAGVDCSPRWRYAFGGHHVVLVGYNQDGAMGLVARARRIENALMNVGLRDPFAS